MTTGQWVNHPTYGPGVILTEFSPEKLEVKFKTDGVKLINTTFIELTPCDAPATEAKTTWPINGKDEDISSFLPALKYLHVGGPEVATSKMLGLLGATVTDSNGRRLRAAYDYYREKGIVICVSNRGAWIAHSEVCRDIHLEEKLLKIKGLTDGIAPFKAMDIEASKQKWAELVLNF